MANKKWWNILLFLYIIVLSWGILLKFALPPYYLGMAVRIINLVPYKDVARTWDGHLDIREIFLNIVSFIPLGVGFYRLGNKKFWSAVALSVAVSLFYEGIQYLLAIGMADVTDVIHNSLGGLIGVLIAMVLIGGKDDKDSKG